MNGILRYYLSWSKKSALWFEFGSTAMRFLILTYKAKMRRRPCARAPPSPLFVFQHHLKQKKRRVIPMAEKPKGPVIWQYGKGYSVKKIHYNGYVRDIKRGRAKWRRFVKWAEAHGKPLIRFVSMEALKEKGFDLPAPDSIEDIDLRIDLRAALEKLTAAEQALIEAYYYRGLSEPQISEQTLVPQRTINDRRNAVIKKLREKLK